MARKTLEDKVKDANTAFGNEYCLKVEEMGYYLMHGISKIGVRDSNAAKKEKDKPCLVAYVTKHEENQAIEPEILVDIARNIIPFNYKGFRVFLEYRQPFEAMEGPFGPVYGPISVADESPAPDYGVPVPPEKRKKK
ncbi:MAG: hypothetical protein QME12_04850 [Nanoarchaeota archaeon]|nr:hypothetical protein [Nanoarchaeota archaeon]